jgi:hypothetical protein
MRPQPGRLRGGIGGQAREGRVVMEEGREERGGAKRDGEAPLLLLEVKAAHKGGRLAHTWAVSAGRYSGEWVWR